MRRQCETPVSRSNIFQSSRRPVSHDVVPKVFSCDSLASRLISVSIIVNVKHQFIEYIVAESV